MSLHRALRLPTTRRGSAITKLKPNHFIRWQQTRPAGGTSAIKLLFYGTAGLGMTAAGTIAYSRYNPVFKDKINDFVPGFSKIADSAAEQVGSVIGSRESPTGNKTPKKDKVELVFKVENKDKTVTGSFTKTKTTKANENTVSEKMPDEANPSESVSADLPQPEVTETSQLSSGFVPDSKVEPVSPSSIEHPPPQAQPTVTEKQAESASSGIKVVEEPKMISKQPLEEAPSTELITPVVEDQTSKQSPFPVESAVASVREETGKVAEKIMSEQVREHQSSQTLGESWMQDTAKVDAKLQEAFEDFKTQTGKVLTAQKAVIEAITQHQLKVVEVIRNTTDSASSMETLADEIANSEETLREKREELVEAAVEHQEKTKVLRSVLSTAEEVGLKSKAEEIVGDVTRLLGDVDMRETSIREAESSSEVLRNYQEEAKKSKEQLQRELGTVPPKSDLKQEAIVLMQSNRINVLKQKLEGMEQEKAQSLTAALEKQKQKLEQLAEEKLRLSLQRQKLQLEQAYVRREYDIAHEFDSELREKLRLQSEAHTSHLTDALRSQASELGVMWSEELEMKLMEQEAHYQTELGKVMARLRGIESMVDTVANAGELTRHQQIIRNACDTLSGALDRANANPYDRFTFSKELSSLCKAADGDKFVLSVIKSIPEQAISKSAAGIQSESGLYERFQKVYKICKRVALVPETGGGLGTYALSYLQSLLVFNMRGVKETQDLSSLDTFDLLTLADGSMQRGDLEKAVWYVSHLKNESRRVAQDWLEDARLYLETRQAVRLIQTYTAATNIAFN